jgi:hypothetical protein
VETSSAVDKWLRSRSRGRILDHSAKPTYVLGGLGALLYMFGLRRPAGLIWVSLGAGSIGAAVSRASNGSTIFPAWFVCLERERRFLALHLPFLLIGGALILGEDKCGQAD